jgi:hypothetical protein
MLAAGVLAPQMVAACGGGRLPDLSNVVVAPGETGAVISFSTEAMRDARVVIWSNDVPQSYQSVLDPSEVMQHSMKILGLQPDMQYHYEIRLHNLPDDSYVAYAADLRTRPASASAGQAVQDESDAAADGA